MDHNFAFFDVIPYYIIFCRILGIMFVMPILSQQEIPAQVRVILSLGLCFLLTPIIFSKPIPPETSHISLFFLGIKEFAIGFSIGMVAKFVLIILDIAGTFIANNLGLSNAVLFNPALETTTSLPAIFLTLAGTTSLLVLDLHHLVIEGITHSYKLMPVFETIPIHDIGQALSNSLNQTLTVSLQISFPFIIVSIIIQLALGLLNRLVPTVQVFFIGMPLQIISGLIILLMAMSTIMFKFSAVFDATIKNFLRMH